MMLVLCTGQAKDQVAAARQSLDLWSAPYDYVFFGKVLVQHH